MQRWIWRQLRVELPEDWELLQFSRSSAAGRCAFADRYQFRFELNWREVPGPPDLERMLGDYQSRLAEEGLTGIRRIRSGPWQGVAGTMPDRRTTSRYGGHVPPLGCIVELVFLWPGERCQPVEEQVLASFGPETEAPPGQVRWRAFGMELLTTADGTLERCRADPGFQEFRFTSQRRRNWERFSRRGLLSWWLQEPVQHWQRRQLPRHYRVTLDRQEERRGHAVARLHGERSRRLLPDWLFGRREFAAAAWVCPRDGRLYQVAREGYPHALPRQAAPPAPSLRCCADLEVTP